MRRDSTFTVVNRRILKTVRTVVWERWPAQSDHPDPISLKVNRSFLFNQRVTGPTPKSVPRSFRGHRLSGIGVPGICR